MQRQVAPRQVIGDGQTNHAFCLEHEVHHLRRDLLRRTNQIAFVLSIFIVGDEHKLAGFEVGQRTFYGIKSHLLLRRLCNYSSNCLCHRKHTRGDELRLQQALDMFSQHIRLNVYCITQRQITQCGVAHRVFNQRQLHTVVVE